MEIHSVDTEAVLVNKLRGEGDCGVGADVENPPDESVPPDFVPGGPVNIRLHSNWKQRSPSVRSSCHSSR